jgi:hypothetical protein
VTSAAEKGGVERRRLLVLDVLGAADNDSSAALVSAAAEAGTEAGVDEAGRRGTR